MTAMESAEFLGNIGEFVGAIGVIVTLIYLAIQVRHSKRSTDANTRALEEARALAISQTYENRTISLLDYFRDSRDSAFIAEFIPGNEAESRHLLNMRWWQAYMDNLHYQHTQGYLDQDYFDSLFVSSIHNFARIWRAAGISEPRLEFRETVDRILAEADTADSSD